MPIDSEEVRRIAELARLELDETTVETLRPQLQRILDYVAMLDAVDTERVPPTSRTGDEASHLREDRVEPSAGVERVVREAPESADGFFRVPRVIR